MSETSPPPPEAVIQTAARLLAAGRAVEAADLLHQLVDEAPTYAAAHVLLASALDATGRPTDALDIWRRAAFLVPHSPLVHRERQRLMTAHGAAEPDEAPSGPVEVAIEDWSDDAVEPEPLPTPEEAAPGEQVAPDTDTPNAKLATSETEGQTDLASSIEEIETPDDDLNSLETESEPEAIKLDETPSEISEPGAASAPEEPVEAPLLPPEGTEPSAPSAPVADLELADDGWTILDDDDSPPEQDVPVGATLLPPEPQTSARTPVLPPEPEANASPNSEPSEPDSISSDDLDDLITQLDAAPRIKPDPTFSGPKVTFDESSMDDMVSETLAKIYAAQHQYVEAAVVYERLAEREPAQAEALLERAAEMREKAR